MKGACGGWTGVDRIVLRLSDRRELARRSLPGLVGGMRCLSGTFLTHGEEQRRSICLPGFDHSGVFFCRV